jgi:cytochrome d ubiquinol oxidase subunit II
VSDTVRARWFSMPEFIALLPIPLFTLIALGAARSLLNSQQVRARLCALPFFAVVLVFVMGGVGLAYSIFPFVVMDKLTLWEAASARESLAVILVGVAITVPAIAGYTVFSYRVFRGKASALSYG